MGHEVYCLICGGPVNNSGSTVKNVDYLKKVVNNLDKKVQKTLGVAKDNMESFLDNVELPENVEERLRKDIIELSNQKKYAWLNQLLLLHTSGRIIPVTTEDSWEQTFFDNDLFNIDCYTFLNKKKYNIYALFNSACYTF